jgi:hypothetical protein
MMGDAMTNWDVIIIKELKILLYILVHRAAAG